MRWPRIVLGLFLLLVLWLWFLANQIYRYSRESYSQPADVAIVLGAAVWNERPYYYASYLLRRPFISDVVPNLRRLSVQTLGICRPLA
jgi:hypothetical protein